MANQVAVISEVRTQLDKMTPQLRAALPAGIRPEKFNRVVMTVLQQNPELLNADRKSLFSSCMQCAQHGLVPDGREAALVVFKGKVQYIPMIYGLRKLARESGEIADWRTRVVYENDEFEFQCGDQEFIKHKPNFAKPGAIIAAYSIIEWKDGSFSREVMSIGEIERIRQRSRAKDSGPWVTDFPEMAKKTVGKRGFKVSGIGGERLQEAVKHSDEVEGLVPIEHLGENDASERDLGALEALEHIPDEPEAEAQAAPEPAKRRGRPAKDAGQQKAAPAAEKRQAPPPGPSTSFHKPIEVEGDDEDELASRARAAGHDAYMDGAARQVPSSYRYKIEKDAWLAGYDAAAKDVERNERQVEPDVDYGMPGDQLGAVDDVFSDLDLEHGDPLL